MGVSAATEKRLFALSRNECAFRGCTSAVSSHTSEDEAPVTLGEIAHIVGRGRQGPRGRLRLSSEELDRIGNLILLCEKHHKIVDANPTIYSVEVLRKMKTDHETPSTETPAGVVRPFETESLFLTALPITDMPAHAFRATTRIDNPTEIRKALRGRGPQRSTLSPFILRGDSLLSFHDLSRPKGLFSKVVDVGSATALPSAEMWRDPDLKRWYVELMNRGLSQHLGQRGVSFDRVHKRHFFRSDGQPVTVTTVTKTGRRTSRQVVFPQIRRATGEGIGIWWHWATRLRFEEMVSNRWCFTIRPEFHLTKDGMEPLEAKRVGRRITRKKSTMYNEAYFDAVQFWRAFLCNGDPRFILPFGFQSVVVDGEFMRCDIEWPRIGDKRFKMTAIFEENLLTSANYLQAVDDEHPWTEEEIDEEEAG